MTIQGIIFDFDGLILDTETPDYTAWTSVFSAYGTTFEFDEWAAGVGKRQEDFDLFTLLQSRVDRSLDRPKIIKEHHNLALEMILNQPLQPGIRDFIINARLSGFRLAVASSSDKKWVTGNLDRHDLSKYFDYIFTVDDVTRAKPDPELYTKTLEAFMLQPCEAIAIEDSPNGIAAARAAGLFCIAVPNQVTSKMNLSGANFILGTLENMTVDKLLEILNQREIC